MRVIYCAGEQGRVVLDILRRARGEDDIVFLDDDSNLVGELVDGIEVIGDEDALDGIDTAEVRGIVAYGAGQSTRLTLAERFRTRDVPYFSALDPTATISNAGTVGDGVIINAQSYVGPGARIDDLVLVDSAVVVSHDVHLEEGVTVGPDATMAGAVTIGRDAYIGAGATISDHVSIGREAVVGAGAVVTGSVPSGTTVAGVPAEPIDDG